MAYNSFINKQVGIQSPTFRFQKDRNNGAVLAGDGLGEFQFYGFDGTNYLLTSNIKSVASGTITANRIGSNIEFYTHPDSVTASTQRMVIENTGQVQINDPSSNVASLFVVNNQSTPNLNLRTANSTATNAPHIHFTRSRAGTADVLANDELGRYEFFGFQGGTAREAAEISAVAETVNGTNAVSGYLSFSTVPTTYAAMAERLRISGDGTVTINNPVSGVALNIVGGGQTVIGDVNLNITGTANTNINSTSNSGTVTIGNTSSGAVTIDCGTAGISVGTTANAHTSTFGSTNSTSATTVQSGTGALNVTSTNGALTINSGTGTLALSNDASNTTVNLATGAAVKTVQLGSTNTTSSLVLRSGTGNIVANTGLTVDSIGRMTNTAQPCFVVYASANINNITGDGTAYNVIFNTERIDQGNYYDTATGLFTAPRTGTYFFSTEIFYENVAAGMTLGALGFNVNGANIVQGLFYPNPPIGYGTSQSKIIWNLTAGDTVNVRFVMYLGAKQVDITGGFGSNFGGILLC